MMMVCAQAFSGKPVKEEDVVRNSNFTWKRLQDRSVCLIENDIVVVPYSAIRYVEQGVAGDLSNFLS